MATALDNLGREISSANMTLGEIKGLIGTLMKKDVGPAKSVEGTAAPKNQESLDELQKLFETYTKDYNAEVEEQKGLLQTIIDTLRDITGLREEKSKEPSGKGTITKDGKIVSKEEKLTAKASDRFAKEFHKTIGTKGSGWVHDPYCEKVLNQILAVLTKSNKSKGIAQAAGVAGDAQIESAGLPAPSGGEAVDEALDEVQKKQKEGQRIVGGWFRTGSKQSLDDLYFLQNVLANINKMAVSLQENFLGFNGFDMIVRGISDEERKFTQEIRATAYEVAGVTKESRALQRVYEDIGTSAAVTGMDRTQTQKFYMKALKAGIRDTKTALNLTKAQLNTERQIGVEAGTLNDTFMTMAHAGRMNNAQIADMGRGMREVAKHTGITGDELVAAIKSSEEFTTNLRKAATLTSSSVKNILEVMAHANKLGVGQELQPLLKAMTSSTNLLFEASKGTQAFLFQAASSMENGVELSDKLRNGVITRSKKDMAAMADGMENVLKNFGLNSIAEVENLSDEQKAMLNAQLNRAYGIELGTAVSAIESFREGSRGVADRLKEIGKQELLNLTIEERAALEEKKRALQAGASMSILTALSEATKGTGEGVEGMNQALAKFERRRGEFEGDMNAMGQTWTSSGDAARQSIQSALDQINAGRKKAGMEAVQIDSSDIEAALKDKDALALVMDRLTKGEQELATANKEQLDPMTEMAGHLRQINDNIRVFTQSLFSKMFNSVIGKLVAIAGVLASIAVGVGYLGFNIINTFQSISSLLTKTFGRLTGAGTAAAETAAGAGRAAAGAGRGAAGAIDAADDVVRAPKTLWEKTVQRWRIATKKADRAIVRATDSAASSIAQSSAKLGDAIAANPAKAFGDMVADSWRGTRKIAENGATAVRDVAARGWEATTNLARTGWDKTTKAATRGWEVVSGAPRMLGTAVTDLRASVQAAGGVTKFAAKGFGGMTRAIGTGMGAVVKGGGKAASGLLKLAGATNPVGWAILGVMAAIDGLTGSMEAGARAGQIFGKAQEDVTLNEEYAAKSAGLLVGVLNGIFLGIPGLIFPLDKVTAAIARFNAKVPILTIALAPLVVTLEALWGVISGLGLAIWEIMKGLWDGVMNILTPVFEGLSDIFSTIGSMFGGVSGQAGGLTKAFREMGGVVGIVSGAIKFVGTAIGWIFKAIGAVVGFILKAALKLIEGFLVILEPIGEVISALWSGILEIGQGIGDVFVGLWDVVKGIGGAIYDLFSPIFGLFSSGEGAGIGFMDVMKGIGKLLAGPLVIALKIVLQPLMLLAKVLSGIGKLVQAVVKVFRGDFSGAGQLVKEAVGGIIDAILWPFKGILSWFGGFGQGIYNVVSGTFSWIAGFIGSVFTVVAKVIGAFVSGFMTVFNPVLEVLSSLWDGVKEIGKGFADVFGVFYEIFSGIYEIISITGGLIYQSLKEMFAPVGQFFGWIGSLFGGFSSNGEGFFTEVLGWVKAIGSVVGNIAGFFVKLLLRPLMILGAVLGAVGKVIQAIVKVIRGDFSGAGKLIGDAVMGIINAIIWPFKDIAMYFYEFGSQILDNLLTPFKIIYNVVSGLVNGIVGFFQWMSDVLWGHSIIPDMIMGIVAWFAKLPVMVYGLIGKVISGFADMVYQIPDLIWAGVEKIVDAALWPFKTILNFFGAGFGDAAVGNVKAVLGFIFDLIVAPFRIIAKVISGVGKVIQAVGAIFKGDFSGAASLVKDALFGIFDTVLLPFKKFGSWLWDNTIGKMSEFGSWLWDNTIGKMSGFGSWLYDNSIGKLADMGNWLWDTLTNTFTKVMDWILSWIPGGGSVKTGVQAYSATEEENQKRVEAEGSSISGGLGRTLGGITNLDLGKTWGGIKETGGAVLNAINPFNWFEEGTRKVEQTGVGVLHKNEMVVPANDVEKLTAKGAGPFEGESFISDLGSMMTSGFTSLMDGSMMSKVGGGIDYLTGSKVGSSMLGEGSMLNDMNKSVGAAFGVQPPSAKAIETRMTAQETESALDSARFLYEMHTLATTGKGLKVRMAKQGENFEQGLDLSKMMVQLASPGMSTENILPDAALADLPLDEKKLGPNPVVPESGESALAPPPPAQQAAAATFPAAVTNAGQELAQRTASTQPTATEVVSPDLGELTAETSEQTMLMSQLVNLMQQFVDLAKPKSSVARSSGGEVGDPAARNVAHSPPNYFRAPIGHVAQTAGKAILNVGPQVT